MGNNLCNNVFLAYNRRGGRVNIKVRNGNVEQALRTFKRKVNDSNKLFDYREKEFYEKPTTKKQKKKAAARVRERKRQEKQAQNPFGLK
jgi:small subunit ribosomal protein S21